jgi:hypothetical protein
MCLALVAFVASTSKAEEQNIAVLDLMFFSRSRVANPTCFDVSGTPSHTLPFLFSKVATRDYKRTYRQSKCVSGAKAYVRCPSLFGEMKQGCTVKTVNRNIRIISP